MELLHPAAAAAGVRDTLIGTYQGSGWGIRPVLETILISPDLYEGPPMVKPPVVQLAGMLRALGATSTPTPGPGSANRPGSSSSGRPTSPAGTTPAGSTPRGCGPLEHRRLRPRRDLGDAWGDDYSATETADEALARALGSWGSPALRDEHRAELLDFSRRAEQLAIADWQQGPYRAMRQNALLQLIGVSPDLILQ